MSFERTELLLGKEIFNIIKNQYIAIFGLGGVGSHAAEFLARAGVEKFYLVDFDTVSKTNLNRVIHATNKTIGMPKVEAMKERILEINPNANIKTFYGFFAEETKDEILDNFDYAVDAIDSMNLKVLLLKELYERKIKTISSMGAAGKIDMSKIKIVDISKTHICPLAKRVRKMLHRFGIYKGISAVFSTEESKEPVDPEIVNAELLPRGRTRKIHGSISYIVAGFGCFIANWIINDIINNSGIDFKNISNE